MYFIKSATTMIPQVTTKFPGTRFPAVRQNICQKQADQTSDRNCLAKHLIENPKNRIKTVYQKETTWQATGASLFHAPPVSLEGFRSFKN